MNALVTIPNEIIISKIFLIRGKKVMFDKDLADLYEVETKALNQAVKRNIERFPADFSFTLTHIETLDWQRASLRSHIVTLKRGKHIKHAPRVFTEQGVAMLSSVLKSPKAIEMNVQIIRTFTALREIIAENLDLSSRLDKLEEKYDSQINSIVRAIKLLTSQAKKPKGKFGFSAPENK